eukprot:749962-Hanusia_phi.AAC.1
MGRESISSPQGSGKETSITFSLPEAMCWPGTQGHGASPATRGTYGTCCFRFEDNKMFPSSLFPSAFSSSLPFHLHPSLTPAGLPWLLLVFLQLPLRSSSLPHLSVSHLREVSSRSVRWREARSGSFVIFWRRRAEGERDPRLIVRDPHWGSRSSRARTTDKTTHPAASCPRKPLPPPPRTAAPGGVAGQPRGGTGERQDGTGRDGTGQDWTRGNEGRDRKISVSNLLPTRCRVVRRCQEVFLLVQVQPELMSRPAVADLSDYLNQKAIALTGPLCWMRNFCQPDLRRMSARRKGGGRAGSDDKKGRERG